MALSSILASAAADASELGDFQRLISRCPAAALRKELILTAHCCGAIDQMHAELLIQAYQLETA